MKYKQIGLLNLAGFIVLGSWLWPTINLWTTLDDRIFRFFNQFVRPDNPLYDDLLALLNTRFFDAVAFGIMALLFVLAWHQEQRPHALRRWLSIGITMVVTAAMLAVFTHDGIRYGHPSPTRFYDWAWHLTNIVSIPTKDSAGNSFPGDHGLMLMIFAAFMWRFAARHIAIWATIFVVILSLPRIMVGAHWFSDIYMGSLSIALIILPWLLCTPLIPKSVDWLSRHLPRPRQLQHHC